MDSHQQLNIVLVGSTGRMGVAIEAAANCLDDVEIAARISLELNEIPAVTKDLVVVDFSNNDGAFVAIETARKLRSPLLVGTTGLCDDCLAALRELSQLVPVAVVPNTSRGITMLDQVLELLGRACAQDGDWETQLSEMHHTRKVDRPSGTALALAKALVRGGLAVDPDSIESIRRDEEPGTHDVVLSTPLERVTIRHEALDRSLFAFGAIDMARSLKRCPAGQFSAAQLRPLSVIDGF